MRWRAAQLGGVQVVYLVRLMVLAKLLAPEAFGLLAIASIAVSVLMRLSDVGMIPALVQQTGATREQYDAAWTVGLTRAVLVTLALVIAAPLVALLFAEPRATPVIQALAFRPLIEAGASIGVARLTRDLEFRELALIYLPGALVDLVIAVVLAPSFGVWALVAGTLAGSATMVASSYLLAPHSPRLVFRWDTIAPLMNYGRWVLARSVVLLAGTFATQLAISRMLGAAVLGLFFLAAKVAMLPIEAATSVIGSVAFPMFAGLRDDRAGSTRGFAALLAALVLVLVPVYLMMIVLAPLFEETLGGRWVGTAPIIQVLALAGAGAILADLMVPLLMGQGRADRAFYGEGLQTAVLLLALLPGIALFGVTGAGLAWLAGNAAATLLASVWAGQMVPGAFVQARPMLLAGTTAGLAAAAAGIFVATPLGGWTGLIGGGLAGALTAAAALWALDRVLGLQLREFGLLLVGSRDGQNGASEAKP